MNTVLKHGNDRIAQIVRPFGVQAESTLESKGIQQRPHASGNGDPESTKVRTLKTAFDQLAEQNAKLLSALEVAKEANKAEKKSSFEAGRKAGLSDAVTDEENRQALIIESSKKALEIFEKQLESLEALSLSLAQNALNKVLGPDQPMSDLVTRSLLHRISGLRDHAKIEVTVSSHDFCDEIQLRVLEEQIDQSNTEVKSSKMLKRGGCQIKLRLGTVDVGIPGQLEKINILLNQMSDEEIS